MAEQTPDGYVAIPDWRQIPPERRRKIYRAAEDEHAFIARVSDGQQTVFVRQDVAERLGLTQPRPHDEEHSHG